MDGRNKLLDLSLKNKQNLKCGTAKGNKDKKVSTNK